MTILIQNGTMQSDKTKFSRDEIEKWHAGFMRDCPTGKEHGFEIYTRLILLTVYRKNDLVHF